MRTHRITELLVKARWLVLLLAFLVMHFWAVSLLLALGSAADVTTDDNLWLKLADRLSVSDPQVDAAIARYERQRAMLVPESERFFYLELSLYHWERAGSERPLWPYYQLGALDSAVMLDRPADNIQERFSSLIRLAPNERGIDRGLLELALFSWHKLKPDQQVWMLHRIESTRYRTRHFVFEIADQLHLKPLLCARLPWTQVKNFCRG